MLRYLFLCFTLFPTMKIATLRNFKTFHFYNHQVICMVPPGDLVSKAVNSATTPNQGCRTSSQTRHNRDGTTTEHVTITCSKKIKRDKRGNVIKETDTSQPRYQSGQNTFFNPAPKGASGACSLRKDKKNGVI